MNVKLLIYQSIYLLTLNYGHDIWVMTERMRSQASRRYRILETFILELLLLHKPVDVVGCLSDTSQLSCSRHVQLRIEPGETSMLEGLEMPWDPPGGAVEGKGYIGSPS